MELPTADQASDGPARSGEPARPLAASRKAEVLAAISARGMVRVTELATELGVTPVTVRRDVAELAKSGLLRRVHGGAVALGSPSDPQAPEERAGVADQQPSAGAARGEPAQETIGMLVPSLDFYWPAVARGAEEQAAADGMAFRLRGSKYDATDERADIGRLLSSGARGLLLAPTMNGSGGEHMREWLATASVPVVLMERRAVVGDLHRAVESVITDHTFGASIAVHHLVSLGHSRIGLAISGASPHAGQIRAGWLSTCEELGLPTSGIVDLPTLDRKSEGFDDDLDTIIDTVRSTGTTALLVHSDPEAIRLLQRCQERGLSVPGDLSIVSYDDEVASLASPALSAIRPPRRTIGRTAVTLLVARMADPGRPVHQVTVSPTIYVRDTSGPPGLARRA